MNHRRLRHLPFSSRALGASLSLFAPAIRGYSDNDLVDTWSDITGNGNNATAAGSARPTYKTAIRGGMPVLRFIAVNFMDITDGFTNTVKGSDNWSIMWAMVRKAGGSSEPVFMDAPSLGPLDFFFEFRGVGGLYWGGGYRIYTSPNLAEDESGVLSFTKTDATSGTLRKNGDDTGSFTGALNATSSSDSDLRIMTYRSGSLPGSGDVGACVILNDPSDAHRRRIEQSLGFTFRIKL